MTPAIDLESDLVRTSIRSALYILFEDDRVPEGIELFRWHHVPMVVDVRFPAVEDGVVSEVVVDAQIQGQIGFVHPTDGDKRLNFWVGWDKNERVGVIACGDQRLFPGDPRK